MSLVLTAIIIVKKFIKNFHSTKAFLPYQVSKGIHKHNFCCVHGQVLHPAHITTETDCELQCLPTP